MRHNARQSDDDTSSNDATGLNFRTFTIPVTIHDSRFNCCIFTFTLPFWRQRRITEQFTEDPFQNMLTANYKHFVFILKEGLSPLSDVHEMVSFTSPFVDNNFSRSPLHSKCIIHESRLPSRYTLSISAISRITRKPFQTLI